MADINTHTVHENFDLDGQTPQAMLTGVTPDISMLAEFRWYQWIKWFDENANLPEEQERYGRYLGPARGVGNLMTAKVLNEKGNVIYRSTFRAITREEEDNPKEQELRNDFDRKVEEILGPDMKPEDMPQDDTPEYERYEDDDSDPINVEDRDDVDQNAIDMYLKAEVLLPIAGEMRTGSVSRRKRDADGNLIGKAAANPIMDTRMYVVTFPDGREAEYSANVIAENMLSMCDPEGNQYILLKHITDHRKDDTAISKENGFVWMVMDGSKEQTKGDFRRKLRDAGCHVHQTEPYTPWSDRAELAIRELKRKTRRQMMASHCPKRLWDECLELMADINTHTVHENFDLDGQTPQAMLTGVTPDISMLAEFRWYQWIKWFDENANLPEEQERYGRYLGPARGVGNLMTAKVLNEKGNVIYRSTFRAITREEEDNPKEQELRNDFDRKVEEILGPDMKLEDMPQDDTPEYERYEDDDSDPINVEDRDDVDQNAIDMYLKAEVLLPIAGEMRTGSVSRRKRDADGNLIGKAAANPIMDTRMYVVTFPDGREAEYSANVIAENMLSMCDPEGNQYILLKHITDHRKDDTAISKENGFVWVRGRKCPRKTTKGWQLCVEWKDGTTSWEPLSALKESNPVEVAEYAVAHNLTEEPAFKWWVPFTLRKRDAIISAVNNRYWKRTHKFGIRVPKSVKEAYEIDRENGDNRWAESIQKEMNDVRVAFHILDDGQTVPPGYQFMKCHLVFDIKFDGFRFKTRMVAGGHMVETPAFLTYASVVSRETVRIALLMAALHDLDVKAADVQNAYLTAPTTEKIWTICGPEFGPDEGKKAIIVRALYGLKGSGASYRNHISNCMRHLGYESCKADPDLWMKPRTRLDDGFEYYSYVLIYVDDILVISHDALVDLKKIDYYFKMKEGSIGDPDIYLGSKIRKIRLPNQVDAWMLSPTKYIMESVKNVERYLEKEYGQKLPKRVSGPFPTGYRPEIDITPELVGDEVSYFYSQIGVLRWIVELGRIDIITEVSSLASCLALPRKGHLEAVFHLYAYLKKKSNGTIVMDPTYPTIDLSRFNDGVDWSNFYGDVKEALPLNMPKPRGKPLVMRLFVDSDHAADKLFRRSRTGFIIYLNSAPIIWYSKRQGTIETSVFGAEFVAMRTGFETARALRYKLRMMGIPVDEPVYCYGDNMSVIHNTQRPESTLKKKSNSICYHFCREAIAMGEAMTAHIRSEDNPADICTKLIPGGLKRDRIVNNILYYSGGQEERVLS
ncbi:reverse transcriptase RNA-dependent DNA polymerase [Nitzschia inconspicua]|uniref:Reverse transcriptase RNA-dependent DNA polymerase n=1 Tax=Nitzschia inconspicua TaxID=303405 RepID=A0A9K3Q3W7_9STRA|nr:reverse transcriptase RNA-dependent DNA polymerase [Nitzschia inconspicua]